MASRADITLLLRRGGFTPRPAEVEAAMLLGPERVVDQMLAPGAVDPGAAATPPPQLDDPAGLLEALREKKDTALRKATAKRLRAQSIELTAWWMRRMVATSHPFGEKMTFFWHSHFATSVQKVRSPALMLAQQERFRSKGLGSFEELAVAVAKDPAMMRWLDTGKGGKTDPNENFARENFELFVLGHGNYSESDVREAARAFTGWHWTPATGFRIAARQHDDGSKTILGHTGNLGGEDVVRLAASQPAAQRWVASRIWSRFAGHAAPNDPAVTALLASAPPRPLADLFRSVLLSPQLTSAAVRNGLVKQPYEWVVGAQRAFNVAVPDALVLTTLRSLGQLPFAPASVGGWPEGAAWLSTSATEARVTFATSLVAKADLATLADEPPAGRVDATAAILAVDSWGPATRSVLNAAAGDPNRLAALALMSPEYQLA
jgi:uncharacterized protein (DUF1800 family)